MAAKTLGFVFALALHRSFLLLRFSTDSWYLEGFHRLTVLFSCAFFFLLPGYHPEACQTKLSWVNILCARLGFCLIRGWVICATSSCVRKQRRQGMFHHRWFMTSKWAIEQCFCIPALTNIKKKRHLFRAHFTPWSLPPNKTEPLIEKGGIY